ncbi:hypothetical protein HGB07_04250 [Candidatus Roizmanbacteria bacterium]|nr:hypothetical protein [Candidatus Roizmanbacteria bacterium]
MSIFDDYTRMYFSYVLSGLEEAIHLQGVDIAYIIDNQIEEERFALTAVLFSLAGIAVVTPHPIKGEQIVHQSYEKQLGWALAFFPEDIHAADDSTNTNLTLPEIKKQIGAYAKKKRSITYIEKDDSVNYIDQVVKKLAGTHYTAVLRNLPPSDPHLTEIKHGGK